MAKYWKKKLATWSHCFYSAPDPPPLTRLFNPTFTSRVGSVIPFYEGTSSSAFKGVKVTTRVTLCLFVCLSVCPSSLFGDETVWLKAEPTAKTVWPDTEKFRHFGEILKNFGNL